MPFDDVVRSPLLRKVLEAGEERAARVVQRLLHAANLPSKDDVTSLRRRLEEIEATIDGLAERVGARRGGGGGGR
jgi:hypothetical protein